MRRGGADRVGVSTESTPVEERGDAADEALELLDGEQVVGGGDLLARLPEVRG